VAVIDKLADGDPLVEGFRIALARHARTRRGGGHPPLEDFRLQPDLKANSAVTRSS